MFLRIIIVFTACLAGFTNLAAQEPELSQMYGFYFGQQLRERDPQHFMIEEVQKGLKEGFKEGDNPRYTSQEMRKRLLPVHAKMRGRHKNLKDIEDMDVISYMIGYQSGSRMKKTQGDEIDIERFSAGVKAGYQPSDPPLYNEDELGEKLRPYFKKLAEKIRAQRREESEANLLIAQNFLKNNRQKPDVKELPSGLQYRVIEEGAGASPTPNGKVVIDYTGMRLNGEVFDSKESVTMFINHAIPAWKEALPLMKEGAVWEIVASPELAYGEKGLSDFIRPNEALIFKIHLVEVKTKNGDKSEE